MVDVAAGREDGPVILAVASTGPVIPPADINRLFQPFRRAAGRTGNGGGHELGLSIAAIARAHGASLTTRAQPHGGLHIQVSLPGTGRPQHSLTASRQEKPYTRSGSASANGAEGPFRGRFL